MRVNTLWSCRSRVPVRQVVDKVSQSDILLGPYLCILSYHGAVFWSCFPVCFTNNGGIMIKRLLFHISEPQSQPMSKTLMASNILKFLGENLVFYLFIPLTKLGKTRRCCLIVSDPLLISCL